MPSTEQLVDDLAAAILDGRRVDWALAESSSEATRSLIEQLKVVAAVAELLSGAAPEKSPLCAVPASSPQSDLEEGATRWGHLRVLERIGRGSFGEVYRAWDTRLDREVALKLLPAHRSADDGEASAIIQEGRLLARVRHPNVVTIYGAEQVADRIGLWMEFVRGQTLEQIVEEGTVVSIKEAAAIGIELCRALSAVHGAGVIHRDIKTQNVIRAGDGRIVLMDFGTGRERDSDAASDLAGTPLYLAPEVLEGQPASIHSDLYGLGVLLYRLLTRSYPVRAVSVAGVRRAHRRGDRVSIRTLRPDVPRKLARVIERAIDPHPDRRYRSAEALGADLAALTRRPTNALASAARAAAAFILVVAPSWELAGRQVGSATTPSTLLLRFASVNPVAAVNVSPAERPVIAVLPLKNLSAQPESDYFVDGLTDEIIRNLAVIQGLQVRSRTSSFAFKDKPRNIRDVGDRLGANLVVEGSVLRSGTRLRINVQLVHVADDVPLWSERFDREVTDIFTIQDEISRAIVNKLRLTLGRGQRRYDTNLEAYELYLKARALVDRRDIPNAQKAAELFEQVIARDSAFAPAHAGLANAYAFMSTPYRGIPLEAAYPIMQPAAIKALQLDPLLAEAHAAMGWVYSYERDWANAETAFRRAIDLNPSLTQIYTSYSISTLQTLGKHDEALQLLDLAARNDPLSLDVQREIGEVQLAARRYEEAIKTLRRVYAVDPGFPFVSTYLARALMLAGRPGEVWSLERPGPLSVALAHVRTGQRAEAAKRVAQLANPYSEAIAYAVMEDTERAFEAVERVANTAPHRLGRLLLSPEMGALRGDPRVVALRKKIGLP